MNQTISATNITKTLGCSSFGVNAKLTKGNGKLTYKSSNKNVATINSKGTIKVKSVGECKITITASGTSSYNSASKTVTLKVKPKGVTLKNVTNTNGKRLVIK